MKKKERSMRLGKRVLWPLAITQCMIFFHDITSSLFPYILDRITKTETAGHTQWTKRGCDAIVINRNPKGANKYPAFIEQTSSPPSPEKKIFFVCSGTGKLRKNIGWMELASRWGVDAAIWERKHRKNKRYSGEEENETPRERNSWLRGWYTS